MKTTLSILLGLLFAEFASAEYRTWTRNDGKTAELELLSITEAEGKKSGEFKMRNGQKVMIRSSVLSEADAKLLEDWKPEPPAAAAAASGGNHFADSFYKQPELFAMRPAANAESYEVSRFGPVGMSIELVQPAFQIRIKSIEPDSPAAAAGTLEPGQVIESINGEVLKDIDPRIQLGNLITKTEAIDGLLKLRLKGGKTVDVRIPVIGQYSETWPINCPKSEKIIRNYAQFLIKELGKPAKQAKLGFCEMGMLFLLSTGDDQYLPVVSKWIREHAKGAKAPNYAWFWGYRGIMICEYYLRTGDKSVLALIQGYADNAVQYECFGAWGGRGLMARPNYGGGGGHLNAGATLACGFLMMAKECGANVPDATLHRVLAHFYRYAGRGNVPYGNGYPEAGFVDNGKNGKLAISMAAAAALCQGDQDSVYAQARDTAAMTSFHTTSYMLMGHTGGGIGEIWRSVAIALLFEKMPHHYREFMDQRRWHYELSRRFDGSFGIVGGGGRYDNVDWGAGYALTYTMPRKALRISGAPPGKHSKPFALPANPWGTEADKDFISPLPPRFADGSRLDISTETLADDAAAAINRKLGQPNIAAEVIRKYMHHPNYIIRTTAAWRLSDFEPRFLTEFLKSGDARVRCAALDGIQKGDGPERLIDDDNFGILVGMITDPKESWFVKRYVLDTMKRLPAKAVVPQVDKIIPYLKHEEWWLQKSALNALVPVMAHPACYDRVLPALGECLEKNKLHNVTWDLRSNRFEAFASADAKIKDLARDVFKGAFAQYEPLIDKHPFNMDRVNEKNRQSLGEMLVRLPGGYDLLYQLQGNSIGDYDYLFKKAESQELSPTLRKLLNK